MNSFKYPEIITENFDTANFHIKYCLTFIKQYLYGDILEVGAGCGSFTRNYLNNKISKILLTEKDKKNLSKIQKFLYQKKISEIKKKFNVILYLHVLEHIKNDSSELMTAIKK